VDATSAFIHEPDPQNPGWHTWDLVDQERFNPVVMGRMLMRRENDRAVRVRLVNPRAMHSNAQDNIHGGTTLSLIDIAMFAAIHDVLGADAAASVTVDLSTQFLGAGSLGRPLDALCEVMKESRRFAFMRGTVEQDGALVASYLGTIRKPTAR
jgi:uncharacterized protein (TIGR00369 family)